MDRVRAEALALMRQHGLHGWDFELGNAKRLLGTCNLSTQTIRLSRLHLELDPPDEVRNTILHEIAHALCGPGVGHGPKWKAKAVEIGARPQRCTPADRLAPRFRAWLGTCIQCGRQVYRHRREELSCGVCSPKRFSTKCIVRWERAPQTPAETPGEAGE